MSTPVEYMPSALSEDGALLREHSFTRWMSRDLLQAATDFCKNLGLLPIYAECISDERTRYLFWHMPKGAVIEVRSGRTKEKFEDFDRVNQMQGGALLSLHVSESNTYSAVWISSEFHGVGTKVLSAYGVGVPERKTA